MRPEAQHRRSPRSENLKDAILLGIESLAWLAAWIVVPAALALRGTSITNFAIYAFAAGTLLALGVLADSGSAFADPDHFLWFAALNSLAILLLGGIVFAISPLLSAIAS